MSSSGLAVARGHPLGRAVALLSRPAVFGGLVPAVTLLNALVGMLLPTLMQPRQFGTYALVVTLFQYGLIFDFGASQLIDRVVPAHLGRGEADAAERAGQELLWLRLVTGAVTLVLGIPAMLLLGWLDALPFRLLPGLLSAIAGIAYMVALGPACVHRARSERRDYALSVVVLSAGLVVARPGGLAAWGLDGCFAALMAWYVGLALLLHRRMPVRLALRPSLGRLGRLLGRGLPFFATSFIWAFYLTGNRWFAAALVPAREFGEFAFSTNIFSLLVGAASGLSAFYYPRLSEAIARGGRFAQSGTLGRDCALLVLVTAGIVAVGIVLARVLIGVIYPHYLLAVPTARIMLVAVPPMVLASWLMPVSLSNGRNAWIDGLVVFPIATALLGLTVHALFERHGTAGAAAASTVSAVPLVAMQLAVLCHAGVLRPRHALGLLAATLGAAVALAAVVTTVAA